MTHKKKQEIKFKWSWKSFWIAVLIILLIIMEFSYSSLEKEYDQLKLDSLSDSANMDCYERGTVDCYEKGTVDCYNKGSVDNAENDIEEFLRNHDCYERGTAQCYDKSVYCYDEPQIVHSCEAGYSLACIKN